MTRTTKARKTTRKKTTARKSTRKAAPRKLKRTGKVYLDKIITMM